MAGRILDSVFISGFGASAASGTLSFFAVGTLTPAVVYSDDALSQAITQPIVLDADGKSPTAIYTATALRAIINTASGATLADIERIDGDRAELVKVSNANWTGTDVNSILSTLAGSLGGTDGQYKDAGAGAVGRNINTKFSEVQVSVKDFGAVGNGVANDTTAIQAAINRIIQLGGGTVFVPPGTYNLSAELTVAPASGSISVTFLGAGFTVSIIAQTSSSANTITCSGANLAVLAMNGVGLAATSTSGAGIQMVSGVPLIAESLSITGHENCITNLSGSALASTSKMVSITASSMYSRTASTGSCLSGNLANVSITNSALGGGGTVNTFYCVRFTDAGTTAGTSFYLVNSILQSQGAGGGGGIIMGNTPVPGNVTVRALFLTGATSVGPYAVSIGASCQSVIDIVQLGTGGYMNDARTSGDQAATVTTTSNVFVNPGRLMRINATVAAIAITVIPTPAANGTQIMGTTFDVICANNSGGAVTWTFNSGPWTTNGAVAPPAGQSTRITFKWNSISARAEEWSRLTY
jgi:hypothetical protein